MGRESAFAALEKALERAGEEAARLKDLLDPGDERLRKIQEAVRARCRKFLGVLSSPGRRDRAELFRALGELLGRYRREVTSGVRGMVQLVPLLELVGEGLALEDEEVRAGMLRAGLVGFDGDGFKLYVALDNAGKEAGRLLRNGLESALSRGEWDSALGLSEPLSRGVGYPWDVWNVEVLWRTGRRDEARWAARALREKYSSDPEATRHLLRLVKELGVEGGGEGGVVGVEEAAEILGISRSHLYKLVREGKIPAVKVGKRLRFERVVLEEYMRGGGRLAPFWMPGAETEFAWEKRERVKRRLLGTPDTRREEE